MRERKKERVVLQKIIQYGNEIEHILEKHCFDREDFNENTEFQFAIGMCIIQIGELVTRLDKDFIQKHVGIPWRQIKGMRNIYAHDYDTIDYDMVWETVTKEIPELKKQLLEILKQI